MCSITQFFPPCFISILFFLSFQNNSYFPKCKPDDFATDRIDECHYFYTQRQNLCNGWVPNHSHPPTCQQRHQFAYVAEMKLRIYHIYMSRLMNKGSLSAALMFFQAAEQRFTTHHEIVVNWTRAQRNWSAKISAREWEWEKGLSAAYIPVVPVRMQCACRSINQTNKALRFLSSSFPAVVSWHISLWECFHLLLCSPFRCSRTVLLYFNLWNTERSYRQRWCHPGQPSVWRIATSPRPARGVRSMLICIEAMNSCEMLARWFCYSAFFSWHLKAD